MEIIVNGKEETIKENTNLQELISSMEATLPKFFVVEHNENIVYKENYRNHILSNGDTVEIVVFTGGG